MENQLPAREEEMATARPSASLPIRLRESTPGTDGPVARGTQALYHHFARHGVLAKLGKLALVATGGELIELLPVNRQVPKVEADSCSDWWYCNVDAPRMCTCCVNGATCTCPAGTASGSSWIGCCYNPNLFKSYYVTYYDCCTNNPGGVQCSNPNCSCTPTSQSNWCGSAGTYYCTTPCISDFAC